MLIQEDNTTCAHCGESIVPGTAVAASWIGAPHPYTHATFRCDESGGMAYCGTWGKGQLIGLAELYDFKQREDGISMEQKTI